MNFTARHFFCAMVLLLPAGTRADGLSWTNGAGPEDRNWFTGKNWRSGDVPGQGDDVLINGFSSEAKPVLFNGQAIVNRLQMAENGAPENDSWLSITGGALESGPTAGQAQIGIRGLAVIRQSGGKVMVPSLIVGRLSGGRGTWDISGGTLEIAGQNDTLVLGDGENTPDKPTTGVLTISNSAIVRVARGIQLGGTSSGTGTIQILGSLARLEVGKNMSTPGAEIEVGCEGNGLILIKGGWLDVASVSAGQEITLRIGNRGKGTGTIQGFGTINTFFKDRRPDLEIGNGYVIADGFGEDRTLNLSSYGNVKGAKENQGNFGWFAQNKGRLVLPALKVDAGARDVNWGESGEDPEIDLINSARFTFDAGNTGGRLSVVLLAPDHKDVPAGLPGGVLGLWKVDYKAATAGMKAIQVCYRPVGIGEVKPNFLHYNEQMKRWDPCPTVPDTIHHLARTEGTLATGFYALIR